MLGLSRVLPRDKLTMGVLFTRLVFLAFVGMTGFIVYNALYLQEQQQIAGFVPSAPSSPAQGQPPAIASPAAPPIQQATAPVAVTTDIPVTTTRLAISHCFS